MQKKLSAGNLLNSDGTLSQAGYATSMQKRYKRADVGVSKLKIKEWDYYLIYNAKFAVALTVADNGYMGMLSASVIDFENKKEKTTSIIDLFTRGKYKMPETSKKGDINVKTNQASFEFLHDKDQRRLVVDFKKFDGDKALKVDITLTDEPHESMVIATPFKNKPKAFYYNQKIVGFSASGEVYVGDQKIDFNSTDSFGILDWGRGVWTYKNTWFWGSIAGIVDGHKFGLNLGYGFGDTSAASENMAFYDGYASKLNDITFEIPRNAKGKYDFLMPWKVTSSDGAVELSFSPVINRHSDTNLWVLRSNQNQVFGKFSGTVRLKDGNVVEIKEMMGFAEVVFNKW